MRRTTRKRARPSVADSGNGVFLDGTYQCARCFGVLQGKCGCGAECRTFEICGGGSCFTWNGVTQQLVGGSGTAVEFEGCPVTLHSNGADVIVKSHMDKMGRKVERRFASVNLALDNAFYHQPSEDMAAPLRCLQQHGIAVLRGALGAPQVQEATSAIWDWIEHAYPGTRRGEAATWESDELFGAAEECGIALYRGAGQCQGAWLIRAAPLLRKVFACIWGVEQDELITSFDALFLWRPWQSEGRHAWRTRNGWLHTDDHKPLRGFERAAIQSLVALSDADPATGSFVCIPGSHLRPNAECGGWKHVYCQQGDIVLWDSRTTHASEPAMRRHEVDNNMLLRVAVPVCMVPRSAAKDSEDKRRAQRQHLIDVGATCKHSPHKKDCHTESAGEHTAYVAPQLTPTMQGLV